MIPALLALPQIFTNGDKVHAVRALKRLGLEDCFEGIICFETLNPPTEQDDIGSGRRGILCKPSVESMEAVIEIAKLDAKRTISDQATKEH